jgi:hypothetical protein
MLKVTIAKTALQLREGTSTKTGKPYKLNEQEAFVNLPNGEYRQIKLIVTVPYAVGSYELSDESLVVDGFGGLKIGRIVLKSVK